jgi:hypothetical protein
MTLVYTVGYQRKPLSTFINQLRGAGVDVVIDIRLRNTSHLLGHTKRDTLDLLLREGFDIAYEHHPELAPTPGILDAYRDNGDWTAHEARFLPLLKERAAEQAGREILGRCRAHAFSAPSRRPSAVTGGWWGSTGSSGYQGCSSCTCRGWEPNINGTSRSPRSGDD